MLAGLCLVVILGSILAMNLQVPQSSLHGPIIGKPAISAAGYSTAQTQRAHGPVPASDTVNSQPRMSTVTDADLEYLRSQHLAIPVEGVNRGQLRDTFNEARSEGRLHDAIDIKAPGATPVLAAADGVIAKLFNSRLGGTTLYEFDRSGRFIFYYAHLSGYADGITDGKTVHRGDLLAYVGDTGNAGTGNFHLHFAISKLDQPWKWYGGEAIDPYPLLGGRTLP
jgi:murein DD-endopeptidase MepM/ murein hydrolase activator NlpD